LAQNLGFKPFKSNQVLPGFNSFIGFYKGFLGGLHFSLYLELGDLEKVNHLGWILGKGGISIGVCAIFRVKSWGYKHRALWGRRHGVPPQNRIGVCGENFIGGFLTQSVLSGGFLPTCVGRMEKTTSFWVKRGDGG